MLQDSSMHNHYILHRPHLLIKFEHKLIQIVSKWSLTMGTRIFVVFMPIIMSAIHTFLVFSVCRPLCGLSLWKKFHATQGLYCPFRFLWVFMRVFLGRRSNRHDEDPVSFGGYCGPKGEAISECAQAEYRAFRIYVACPLIIAYDA